MRLSREKTVRLSHRIIDFLVSSPEVDFIEDRDTIRQEIVTILTSLLKLEEQVDTEVRAKIASQKKEIFEGSEEWDILYRKYYAEGLKRLGVSKFTRTPDRNNRLGYEKGAPDNCRAPFLFSFKKLGFRTACRRLLGASRSGDPDRCPGAVV